MRVQFVFQIIEIFTFWHYYCGAVVRTINLTLWFVTRHWKKHKLLIDPLRVFEKFSWCWTSFPIWRVSNISDLQHVHMFMFNAWIPLANTKPGIVFVLCEYTEDTKLLKLIRHFCFILPKKTVLVSAHAQNLFSWSLAKQSSQGNTKGSAPKTVTGFTKVTNEIYLADPGEDRGCSTNTPVINSLSASSFSQNIFKPPSRTNG